MTCRGCGSDELFLFYRQGNNRQYAFYRCRHCMLVNLDLKNVSQQEGQRKYVTHTSPPKNHENQKNAKESFAFICKYLPEKGHFLDIGCGYGSLPEK